MLRKAMIFVSYCRYFILFNADALYSFQPKVDFSHTDLFGPTLKKDELYKVWPRKQSLSAFLEGRATQVISDNVANYFAPLIQVY